MQQRRTCISAQRGWNTHPLSICAAVLCVSFFRFSCCREAAVARQLYQCGPALSSASGDISCPEEQASIQVMAASVFREIRDRITVAGRTASTTARNAFWIRCWTRTDEHIIERFDIAAWMVDKFWCSALISHAGWESTPARPPVSDTDAHPLMRCNDKAGRWHGVGADAGALLPYRPCEASDRDPSVD